MSFQNRAREHYDELSSASRAIVDYILEKKQNCLTLSTLQLGRESGTSSASVIRLSKQLGYKSFEEMKLDIATHLAPLDRGASAVDTIISETDTTRELALKIYNRAQAALDGTLHLLDFEVLQKAIDLLKNAECIYLFGVGSSELPALDLQQKFLKVNRRIFFSGDAHTSLGSSIFITPRDVVLAFSSAGRTKEVNYAVRRAGENGAKIIAVTQLGISSLTRMADVVLNIPDHEQEIRIGAISSTFAQFLIADILFLGAVQDDLTTVENYVRERAHLIRLIKE